MSTGTIPVKMDDLSVTIPMNEFLRLKEVETRVKIAEEAFKRDGYICGSDIMKFFNFKEGVKPDVKAEMDDN